MLYIYLACSLAQRTSVADDLKGLAMIVELNLVTMTVSRRMVQFTSRRHSVPPPLSKFILLFPHT